MQHNVSLVSGEDEKTENSSSKYFVQTMVESKNIKNELYGKYHFHLGFWKLIYLDLIK